MKSRHKRFLLIGIALALLAGATALILTSFKDNLMLFHTPSEVAEGKVPHDRTFKLGGMVLKDSLIREADGVSVHFLITDTARNVPVRYQGALPDLFKEGKGAVAEGRLDKQGVFIATEILAKHDENYMPPAAKDALDRAHATEKTLR
jgi:cytochrome c-type biogenesis protein CcmE